MNYIGSKYSLLQFIEQVVSELPLEKKSKMFCDIFSGTNVVGTHFKSLGYDIICNDIQFYSYVLEKALIENNEELSFASLKEIEIEDPFDYLNHLKGRKGFIYKNYSLGGTAQKEISRCYFSDENARKIDAIRMKLNLWRKKNLLSEKEYFYLVACLLEAADKVANTTSVYEAFLKQLKPSALKELFLERLEYPIIAGAHSYFATNEDGLELLKHIQGDILYMDPPYNSRKYDTNYHILETIALYDNPKIKGKTGVRDENNKRSRFCQKKEAPKILEEMIAAANFEYILLSYNDEGIISLNQIEEVFKKYGEYSRYERTHKRYKADNNRTYSKNQTIEYIHCLHKKAK